MGSSKAICLSCRISSNRKISFTSEVCKQCGGTLIIYPHRFRPQKKSDTDAWKVVVFLYEHGFKYQHVFIDPNLNKRDDRTNYAVYPDNLINARDFVNKYKEQAKK